MAGFEGHLMRCAVIAATVTIAGGCSQSAPQSASTQDSGAAMELAAIRDMEAQEQANLTNFDDLDFNVYSGQKWNELAKSHAPDIVVHWPDGSAWSRSANRPSESAPLT